MSARYTGWNPSHSLGYVNDSQMRIRLGKGYYPVLYLVGS